MTEPTRIERDLLGAREVPVGALYGVHTVRAVENFPLAGRPVRRELVHAYGAVKLAAAETNHALRPWNDAVFAAIRRACEEMMRGDLDVHMVVDALQGGAGTSTNMNVNEVLANRALQLLDRAPGAYDTVDPLSDINRHQSTNDTYPTALKIAAIRGLRRLEASLIELLTACQEKEQAFAAIVKVGRTQLQDAVLTTLGRTMGAYAEAFGRDRWRVRKCEERLRVVNLGGTAIGTGIGAPRRYVFRVVDSLNRITGLGLARAENLLECTQNQDAFVEVSGILSACATNLLKVCGDLRLMASGPEAGLGELRLPSRQAGSSIMPGKVNPVIPEAATQAALATLANHQAIAQACGLGCLELNPFLPLVADRLLDSLSLLDAAARTLARYCIQGLTARPDVCRRHVASSTATLTSVAGALGYEAAEALAAMDDGTDIRTRVVARGLLTEAAFDALTSPEAVMRLGDPEGGEPC